MFLFHPRRRIIAAQELDQRLPLLLGMLPLASNRQHELEQQVEQTILPLLDSLSIQAHRQSGRGDFEQTECSLRRCRKEVNAARRFPHGFNR